MNEKAVSKRVRADCPQVRWLANYTILGPHDYVVGVEAQEKVRVKECLRHARGAAAGSAWSA